MAILAHLRKRALELVCASDTLRGGLDRALAQFSGAGVGALARRGAIWSAIDFGGSQGLRFVSNLVLTRLLFPEAFGLMALVSMVIAGLALFSDTGIRPLIGQSARGDDPDFLNTAWTVNIFRGLLLWLLTLGLAAPVAALYDAPALAQILPIAGLTLLIDALNPTAVHTAHRHLTLGRFILIKLSVQVIGLVGMALLAWQLQSVWALVIGGVITSVLGTLAYHLFLPGIRNGFRLESEAIGHIFHFGKWIFLSTAAGFLVSQGDRAILGLYVSLESLGIYNVAYFLASIPMLLSGRIENTVMPPLYRMKSPIDNKEKISVILRARRSIAIIMISFAGLISLFGPPLVNFLYDDRYVAAGIMIPLFSLSVIPSISLNSITAALIGVGDTRALFIVNGVTALAQTCLLLVCISNYGILGALIAPGLALMVSYPLRLRYSLKYRVFDPVQDFALTLFGFVLPTIACLFYWSEIAGRP
jgi:O-antigen/teichoic acid export membrane protein